MLGGVNSDGRQILSMSCELRGLAGDYGSLCGLAGDYGSPGILRWDLLMVICSPAPASCDYEGSVCSLWPEDPTFQEKMEIGIIWFLNVGNSLKFF